MNNKNEVCIGEEYYLQLIDKVNEYDRLKELYERIYNENCILRENHNINDISLLDKLYKQKEVLDKIKEYIKEEEYQEEGYGTLVIETKKLNELLEEIE